MKNRITLSLGLSASLILPSLAFADDVETIEITGESLEQGATSDLIKQLTKSGVDFSAAGGVSALPVLNGMMGDRILVATDGAPITAACGNQMNPPLSYSSATQVKSAKVLPGVSPVSAGGDNIAGVIEVNTLVPSFTNTVDFTFSGQASYAYRSNDNADTFSASAVASNQHWYLRYAGQQETADSYQDGHGNLVLDTLYKAQNHALGVAFQDDVQQASISVTHQTIPYQGFPNQYMDMTDNKSTGVTTRYSRDYSAGNVEALVSWRDVKHEMGFFSAEKTGMMPMNTDSQDLAAKLKWTFPLDDEASLIIGQGYYLNQLDDWWPAVEGSAMMGPNDYKNINQGERARTAAYVEYQQAPRLGWYYSAGIRAEYVTTDTGEVQAYSESGMSMGGMSGMAMGMSDAEAAMAFNMADRKQDDTLIDVTLLATKQIDQQSSLTMGIARKNRAPNLYERYTWGRSTMATSMIGWFGDGNGYVGAIDLKPETAHTASIRYSLSGVGSESWALEIDAWYTKVSDYIDVEVIGTTNRTDTEAGLRNTLQFTNLDATLKGVNIKASAVVIDNASGEWLVSNRLQWQDGKRDNGNGNLYQILPLQNTLSLQHSIENWQTTLEWLWVAEKDDVDARRLENTTDDYSLMNVNTSLTLGSMTLSAGITNLFDEYYSLPLGGVSIAEFNNDNSQGFQPIAGQGRSVNVGLMYRF